MTDKSNRRKVSLSNKSVLGTVLDTVDAQNFEQKLPAKRP